MNYTLVSVNRTYNSTVQRSFKNRTAAGAAVLSTDVTIKAIISGSVSLSTQVQQTPANYFNGATNIQTFAAALATPGYAAALFAGDPTLGGFSVTVFNIVLSTMQVYTNAPYPPPPPPPTPPPPPSPPAGLSSGSSAASGLAPSEPPGPPSGAGAGPIQKLSLGEILAISICVPAFVVALLFYLCWRASANHAKVRCAERRERSRRSLLYQREDCVPRYVYLS